MAKTTAKKNEKLVSVTILPDYEGRKSKTITLRLNGKKLTLERGKTHKIPEAFARMLDTKSAFRSSSEEYKEKNSV